MANLLVRNVDEEIVSALKARSGKHGISAEEEHRRILRMVLIQTTKKSFAEVLLEIPNVGDDDDFARQQEGKINNVFD